MYNEEFGRKFYALLEELVGEPLITWCEDYRCVKKEVSGYMRLTVEQIGSGIVSMAHWGTQNGDAMRDPEVVFILDFEAKTAIPNEFRNDYMGIHEMYSDYNGERTEEWNKVHSCAEFCVMWFGNLRAQGFYDVQGLEVAG